MNYSWGIAPYHAQQTYTRDYQKKLGMTPQAIRVSVMRKINAILGPVVKSKERSASPNSTVNQSIESNDANDQTNETDAEKSDQFDESIESAAGGETPAKSNREINGGHEAVADVCDVQSTVGPKNDLL